MLFSLRSLFASTLLLIVTLLFLSLVRTYLVVLEFAILPSLQQFNEVHMLMVDKLQLEDGTRLVVSPMFCCKVYRGEFGIVFYLNEAAEEAWVVLGAAL